MWKLPINEDWWRSVWNRVGHLVLYIASYSWQRSSQNEHLCSCSIGRKLTNREKNVSAESRYSLQVHYVPFFPENSRLYVDLHTYMYFAIGIYFHYYCSFKGLYIYIYIYICVCVCVCVCVQKLGYFQKLHKTWRRKEKRQKKVLRMVGELDQELFPYFRTDIWKYFHLSGVMAFAV